MLLLQSRCSPVEKADFKFHCTLAMAAAPAGSVPLDDSNFLARTFVPQHLRAVNEWVPTLMIPAFRSPVDAKDVDAIRQNLIPQMPSEELRSHVFPVRQVPPETMFAVNYQKRMLILQGLKKSGIIDENETLPQVDNISNLDSYRSTFERLLCAERKEILLLYERYSQFDKPVSVEFPSSTATNDRKNITDERNFSKCYTEIRGIADAQPHLIPGDLVLYRPMQPIALPKTSNGKVNLNVRNQSRMAELKWSYANNYVEIQTQVTAVARQRKAGYSPRNAHTNQAPPGAPAEGSKDTLESTWVGHPWCSILRYSVPSGRYNIRIIPCPKMIERCLTALDWLSTVPPALAMGLLFPTEAPSVPSWLSSPLLSSMSDQNTNAETMNIESLNIEQYAFANLVLGRTLCPDAERIRGPMVLTGPA